MAANQTQTPNMTTINAFWNVYVGNMNVGQCSEVTMPIGLKSVIGREGIDIMASRFRNLIEAPVSVTEDPEQGMIKIAPARNLLGHKSIIPGAQKAKPRTSSKAKVARPPNAFILYRQHHHPLVRSEYPELHNNQISVILGTQWKQESDDNKARYNALASRLKARHLQQHPGYQYQPRRPSEKKRRMTRRSASKTTADISSRMTSGLDPIDHQVDLSASAGVSDVDNSEAAIAATPSPLQTSVIVDVAPTVDSAAHSTDGLVNNNEVSGDDFTFSTTAGGNVTFDLGDENIDEDHFAAMLTEYNKSIVPSPAVMISHRNATPVLYNEHTEDAQNDANFYSSMVDLDSFAFTSMDFNQFFDFQAASLPSPTI